MAIMPQAMSNRDVAQVFFELSELLSIRGGEPDRVRAFARIGRTLENLPEPVSTLVRQGRLSVMPVSEDEFHTIVDAGSR